MTYDPWLIFGLITMMLVCGMTPIVILMLLLNDPYKDVKRKKISFKWLGTK